MDDNTIKPRTTAESVYSLPPAAFAADFLAQAFARYQARHPAAAGTAAAYEALVAGAYKNDELAIHRLVVKFSTKWASTDYHLAARQVFAPRLPTFIEAFKAQLLAGQSPTTAADAAAATANHGARAQLIALNLPVPFEYVAPEPTAVPAKKPRRAAQKPRGRAAAAPAGSSLLGPEN